MTDTKRGKGRPAVDDPAVNFRLPASMVARIEDVARERLMQRNGMARAAFLLSAPDRAVALAEADKRWPPLTMNAVREEARRIMAGALDVALDPSPRPQVSVGRLQQLNSRQMREVLDLIEERGPIDQAIYAVLPEWWRAQIDEHEAAREDRAGEEEEDEE